MKVANIRKLVTERDDWKDLRRFDRDQKFKGLERIVGWLSIQLMTKKISREVGDAYFAALKLLDAVHNGKNDELVLLWWQEYRRIYHENIMPRNH